MPTHINNFGTPSTPSGPGDPQVINWTTNLSLGADIMQLVTENGLPSFETKIKKLSADAQRLERRLQLLCPASEESFTAALWWMVQQGNEEDLEAIGQVRVNPPIPTAIDIEPLLKIAEQEINERVNDPRYVMRKGEEAYQLYGRSWNRLYKGEFIALRYGKVVAHAASKPELIRQLVDLQDKLGTFRSYIIKPGESTLKVEGPRFRLGLQKAPAESDESRGERGGPAMGEISDGHNDAPTRSGT